jgi:type IV secretion system protein VirD4
MQLPPDHAIVMVSGTKPIRATKARYYADPVLMARMMAPPERPSERSAAPDPWSRRPSISGPPDDEPAENADFDPANGGIRREPELPPQEEVVTPPAPTVNEFDGTPEEPDAEDVQNRQLMTRTSAVARQASLDRDDGIEL